jgi:hypothetical protein
MPAKPHMAYARRLLSATLLAVAFAAMPASAQEGDNLARAVKATFLYKFLPFVGWPATAFESAISPFYICVAGDDEFGRLAARAAEGQRVGKRAVQVRLMAALLPDSRCHILFAGPHGEVSIAALLTRVHDRPVLTVTDENNGETKGMVHFVIRDGRVRFDIDARLARQSGLSISPKLLELAVRVTK